MGASSQYSEQYDFSSGQDMAHKIGQEKSQLEASMLQSLYGGAVDQAMAGAQRIRDLKRYLEQYGSNPNAIEVIPKVRLAQTSSSQHESDS